MEFWKPLPAFIERLNEDPAGSFAQFYEEAIQVMSRRSPRPINLSYFKESDREDLMHDIVLHFHTEEMKVLRSYKPQGNAFGSWFDKVAWNFVHAKLRTIRKMPMERLENAPEPTTGGRHRDEAPDALALFRSALECVATLTDYDKILVLAAGIELKPAETAVILGRPNENARIGTAIRDAKDRLRNCLHKKSIDPAKVLPYLELRPNE